MSNLTSLLSSKKLIVVGVVVISLISLFYLVISTPKINVATGLNPGLVKILGKEKIAEQNAPYGAASIECKKYRPECETIMNKNRKPREGGFTSEEIAALTPEEKDCVFEDSCLDWGLSERESIDLELSGEQITSLINEFQDQSPLIKNVKVKIENGKIFASASSSAPLLPGAVSLEAVQKSRDAGNSGYGYLDIAQVYLGRLPLPEEIRKTVEREINLVLSDYPGKYNVVWDLKQITNDKVAISADIPKGLVKIDSTGQIIIDLNIMERQEQENGFRIQ